MSSILIFLCHMLLGSDRLRRSLTWVLTSFFLHSFMLPLCLIKSQSGTMKLVLHLRLWLELWHSGAGSMKIRTRIRGETSSASSNFDTSGPPHCLLGISPNLLAPFPQRRPRQDSVNFTQIRKYRHIRMARQMRLCGTRNNIAVALSILPNMDVQDRTGIGDVTLHCSAISDSRKLSCAELHLFERDNCSKQAHHEIISFCYAAIRQRKASFLLYGMFLRIEHYRMTWRGLRLTNQNHAHFGEIALPLFQRRFVAYATAI